MITYQGFWMRCIKLCSISRTWLQIYPHLTIGILLHKQVSHFGLDFFCELLIFGILLSNKTRKYLQFLDNTLLFFETSRGISIKRSLLNSLISYFFFLNKIVSFISVIFSIFSELVHIPDFVSNEQFEYKKNIDMIKNVFYTLYFQKTI